MRHQGRTCAPCDEGVSQTRLLAKLWQRAVSADSRTGLLDRVDDICKALRMSTTGRVHAYQLTDNCVHQAMYNTIAATLSCTVIMPLWGIAWLSACRLMLNHALRTLTSLRKGAHLCMI